MESTREFHFQRRGITDPAAGYPFKAHTYPTMEVKLGTGSLLWDERPEPLKALQDSITRATGILQATHTHEERVELLWDNQSRDFRENKSGPGCYDTIGEWLVSLGAEAFLWGVLAILDDGRDQRGPGDMGTGDWVWLLTRAPKGYIHSVAAVLAYDQFRDGFTPTELVTLGLEDNPENFLLLHLQDLIKAGISGPGQGPIPYPGDYPEDWYRVTIPNPGGGFQQI